MHLALHLIHTEVEMVLLEAAEVNPRTGLKINCNLGNDESKLENFGHQNQLIYGGGQERVSVKPIRAGLAGSRLRGLVSCRF